MDLKKYTLEIPVINGYRDNVGKSWFIVCQCVFVGLDCVQHTLHTLPFLAHFKSTPMTPLYLNISNQHTLETETTRELKLNQFLQALLSFP